MCHMFQAVIVLVILERRLSPINLQWFPNGGLFLMVMLQEITFLFCGV